MPGDTSQQRADEIMKQLRARLAEIETAHRASLEKALSDIRVRKLIQLRSDLAHNVT